VDVAPSQQFNSRYSEKTNSISKRNIHHRYIRVVELPTRKREIQRGLPFWPQPGGIAADGTLADAFDEYRARIEQFALDTFDEGTTQELVSQLVGARLRFTNGRDAGRE